MTDTGKPQRGYCNGPFGQVHWHASGLELTDPARPDLYCLHPSPYSGAAFHSIAPHLAKQRRVIAPDYPGFGASDPAGTRPSVNDMARAIIAVVDHLSPAQPVDVLGFHTGCLVAAEVALLRPLQDNKAVLIDAPAFELDTRNKYRADLELPFELSSDLQSLLPAWEFNITQRLNSLGLDRAFELFVEQLRPARNMNAAFYAAFSYDVEGQLKALTTHCLLIATQSILLQPTRRAAQLIAGSQLLEKLHITQAVLDEAAAEIAQCAVEFLDNRT